MAAASTASVMPHALSDADAPELPNLRACLAGVRATLVHANAAADAWSLGTESEPSLDAAAGSLRRARTQLEALRGVLPGHARRARLAAQAVDRAEAAVAVVRGLPATALDLDVETDEAATDAEEEQLLLVERAFSAAERALVAATTGLTMT